MSKVFTPVGYEYGRRLIRVIYPHGRSGWNADPWFFLADVRRVFPWTAIDRTCVSRSYLVQTRGGPKLVRLIPDSMLGSAIRERSSSVNDFLRWVVITFPACRYAVGVPLKDRESGSRTR